MARTLLSGHLHQPALALRGALAYGKVMRTLIWTLAVAFALALGILTSADERQPFERLEARHLPNAYRIHSKVISGGQPTGDAGYGSLRDLGVKTIISVDGAKPDVAAAKKYGMRYVHLPFGYDGIPADRAAELAKAVRDLPGPIYIHCHHGKHRSPAATSVACVGAGLVDERLAEQILTTAGTSADYRGLYAAARGAQRIDDGVLDALDARFPETAPIPPLAEAMVGLEHIHDHLMQIESAGWRAPREHPDLDPAHEALLLGEHFTELLRTEDVRKKSAEFQQMLHDSAAAAQKLRELLRGSGPSGLTEQQRQQASSHLTRVTLNCKSCHRRFRDNG